MRLLIFLFLIHPNSLFSAYSLLDLIKRSEKKEATQFPHIEHAWRGSVEKLQTVYKESGTSLPQDRYGNNTIIAATSHKENAILRVALKHEKHALHEKDWMGYTATHWACSNGNIEGLRMLLEENAPIEEKEFFAERTPLHLACSQAREEEVYLLLKYNANRNTRGRHGRTPLQDAIGKELNLALIAELMTEENCTSQALEDAIKQNNPIIVSMLINRGVRLENGVELSPSPLYLSEKNGYEKWLQIKQTIELADELDVSMKASCP